MAGGMATSRRSSGRSAAKAAKMVAPVAQAPRPAKHAAARKPVAGEKPAKTGVAAEPGAAALSAKASKAGAAKPAASTKATRSVASKLVSAVPPAARKSGKRESRASRKGNAIKAAAMISLETPETDAEGAIIGPLIEVRRIHRRDINRVWEFIKRSFREVNTETVEYQRPRSKHRFEEIYEEEGVQQLLFEVDGEIVAYAECTYEVTGSDNWINPRYFEKRDMRPMFIDELAVHPDWNGRGVGSFVLEQLHHLARVNGLTHLVLEVAENNEHALAWYKKRSFRKLDAAIFMACALDLEPELLPPRALPVTNAASSDDPNDAASE
jgi:ribosomal protein S18 acetylase RimI-like enzyme